MYSRTETSGYDLKTCGYDLIDKTEEPKYTQNLRYESEKPVGNHERSPGIVRVLLKRLIDNFIVDGNLYDLMRQWSIDQKTI